MIILPNLLVTSAWPERMHGYDRRQSQILCLAFLRLFDLTNYKYGSPYLINRNCFAMEMKSLDNTWGKEAYEKFQEVLLSCEPLSKSAWGLYAKVLCVPNPGCSIKSFMTVQIEHRARRIPQMILPPWTLLPKGDMREAPVIAPKEGARPKSFLL